MQNVYKPYYYYYYYYYLLGAVGLSPGGSGYFTCTQIWGGGKKLENLSREGYMRSMQQQLGNLGTISAFAYRHM